MDVLTTIRTHRMDEGSTWGQSLGQAPGLGEVTSIFIELFIASKYIRLLWIYITAG